jgi:hypothetical protein
MRIRAEQMNVFEKHIESSFTEQIIEHLHLHHSDAILGLSEEVLRERVESFKIRARSYGLTWQSSIIGFVALCFVVGPKFDQQAQVHSVLTDPAIEPNERIQELRHRVDKRSWAQASMVN